MCGHVSQISRLKAAPEHLIKRVVLLLHLSLLYAGESEWRRGRGGVKGGGRGGKGATDERKGTEFIKRCSNCLSTLRGTKIKEAPIIGARYQRAERRDKQIWRKKKVTIKSE